MVPRKLAVASTAILGTNVVLAESKYAISPPWSKISKSDLTTNSSVIVFAMLKELL
jgi:hypothetical protein